MRILLVLGILVLLGIGGLLLVSGRWQEPQAPVEPGLPPGTTVPTPTPAPAAAPVPPESAAPAQAPAATGARQDLDPAAAAGVPAADAATLLVRVVAGADEHPVPGCALYVVDYAEAGAERVQGAFLSPQDQVEAARRAGRRYSTDDAGQVRVPRPQGKVTLLGEAGDLFHLETFRDATAATELVLHLEPEVRIRVLVLDEAGRPVPEVPVAVLMRIGPYGLPLARAVTDEDGRAELRRFKRQRLEPAARHEVAVTAPLSRDVRQDLDPAALPDEPIVFRLPPTGSVVVEVTDLEDRPAADGTVVGLAESTDPDDRLDHGGLFLARQARATTSQGRARFPVVGVGLELEAVARLEGLPVALQARAPGPGQAGECARIHLRPERAPTWLTGRILDAGGQPVATTAIVFLLRVSYPGDMDGDLDTITTDTEGRFRYGLELPVLPAGATRTLSVTLADEGAGGDRITGAPRVEVELAREYPPGEQDLGDLVLVPPPLLAAGTVVGPDGQPGVGADVVLERLVEAGDGQSTWWAPDWRFAATTDASGAFTLYGEPRVPAGSSLQVMARARGHKEAAASFTPGQTGITITLEAAGQLRGSVLVDEGIRAAALTALFTIPGEDGRTISHQAAWNGREFSWTELDVGTGTVEIRADDTREPLYEVEGVTVVPGRENRDPRLQDIDLRGRLRQVHLEFVDERGRRVAPVFLQSLDPRRFFWKYARDGEIDLLLTEDPPPLVATAEGYMQERITGLAGDRQVVLRQGARLEFVLDNPPTLPVGWSLALGLSAIGGENSVFSPALSFDASGHCSYRAPGTGRWQLELSIERRETSSIRTWGLGAGMLRPAEVTIGDPTLPATFHLQVDEAALAEALARTGATD